jgi:hypothetical protein
VKFVLVNGRTPYPQTFCMLRWSRSKAAICARYDVRWWPQAADDGRAEHVRSALVIQTSTCSAIASASSTSMPRYRTVLSILVWPSKSWTARKFPVRR